MIVDKITVTLYLRKIELQALEEFRRRTASYLEEFGFLKDQEYTLENAIQYIIGETLSGRHIEINSHAFNG